MSTSRATSPSQSPLSDETRLIVSNADRDHLTLLDSVFLACLTHAEWGRFVRADL